jgi:hypothetical protein
MKNIKEKEALIKMSLVLGIEPDLELVLEVAKQKKLIEDIKISGDDFIKALDNVVDAVVEEVEQNDVEVIIKEEHREDIKQTYFEYPKPPTLDEISFLIVEDSNDYTEVKNQFVDNIVTIPLPPSLDELLEFHSIKEDVIPRNKLIDKAREAISAQIKNEQVMTSKETTQPNDQTLPELQRKVKYLEQWISRIAVTSPGSGEVNLKNLDDVDTTNLQNNYLLKYNSSNSKFEFSASSGTVANADIVSALTGGENIVIAANGRITSTATGGGAIDLGNISSNIIPTTDSLYNLGSPNKRFQSLYLANNTIDLGGTLISSDGTGTLTISAQGAILPSGSKISLNDQEKEIALVGNSGTVVHVVPFYTQNIGLNTIAASFEFGVDPDSYVFSNFRLNTGSLISTTSRAQFYF